MANIDVMYSSKTDQWATPQDFFDELNEEFGFDLDPCADDQNHKCERYFTREQNGLLQDWGGGAGCSAILHMAKKLENGCRNVMKRATKKTLWWLCSYRPGQIQNISMTTYNTGQR